MLARGANTPESRTAWRPWPTGIAAAIAWTAFGAITWRWPNKVAGVSDWAYTGELSIAALAAAALLALIAFAGPRAPLPRGALAKLHAAGPWRIALALVLSAWEILTAKTATLPTPFFAPPQALIEVYVDDWPRLGDSALNSLRLLGLGVAYGGVAGLLIGVSIGWSRRIGYWVHPVLRVRIVPTPHRRIRQHHNRCRQLDPRFQTLLLTRDGTVPRGIPQLRADCVAASSQAWGVFARIAGVPADKLGGMELLADRDGWLRARGAPGQREWSDADMVCQSGAPAESSHGLKGWDGLTALLLRMDGEPVRFVKGGFVH